MGEVILQSTHSEAEVSYHIPDFGKVTIGPGNVDFWQQFLGVPTLAKLHMLDLNEKDVEQWINSRRKHLAVELVKRLTHKGWKWRESGSLVDMDDFIQYVLEIPLTRIKLVSAIKRNVYTIDAMEKALAQFDSGTEVYNEAFNN